MYNLNPSQEKVISNNLAAEDHFEKVEVIPITESLKKLYQHSNRLELTNSRYSIYPDISKVLKEEVIDVEGVNQFDEPEVISLKSRQFCVASMSLPQVCSTKEAPHPLISAFLNYIKNSSQSEGVKTHDSVLLIKIPEYLRNFNIVWTFIVFSFKISQYCFFH